MISIFSGRAIIMRYIRKWVVPIKVTVDGEPGVYFAVWAPHARRVAVVGDFNEWDFEANYMDRQEPMGIYTCFVPGVKEGDLYKFCIETQQGKRIFKADPYANYAELRPGTASIVTDISHLKWTDDAWMETRKTWDHKKNPMSIYEVHLGSWMRHPGREDEGFLHIQGICRGYYKICERYGIYAC